MGRLRTRDVLWLLPATMTAIGLAVAVGGFAYDLAFAGLPDQDPTPEMEARWRYHCGIASVIELSGLAALLSGFAGLAVVGVCSWMRLHAFSYLIVVVVGAGMFLIIAPGEWKESRCIFLAPYCRFEHGWPFVYMRRWNEYEVFISRPPWLERYGWNWASEKAWNPTNNGSFFSPLALAADLAIALAVIGLPTAAYEIWRRRRSSFWQWHLSDMAIAVSIAAVLCGWWSMHHVCWTREQEALQKLDAMDRAASAAWDAAFDAGQVPPITGCSVDTELQCPAWLQKLLGQGGVPQVCESVISLVIVTWPDAEYERAAPMLQLLPNLRKLGIHDASDRDVLQLPDFRHLVELHLLSSATHPITDAAMAKIGRQTGLTQLTMRGAPLRTLAWSTWLDCGS